MGHGNHSAGRTEVVAPPELFKMVVDSHVVAPGSSQTLQINHEGKPIPITITSQAHISDHGVSYVLDLGGKKVFISGDTACTPAIQQFRRLVGNFR